MRTQGLRRLPVLIIVLGMLLSMAPASAFANGAPVSSTGSTDLFSNPGPGVVGNETGGSGADTYFVLHQAPSLARYGGGLPGLAATSPDATGAARLDVQAPASVAYLGYLASQHDALILAMEAEVERSVEVKYRYDAVLNGVAVVLTPNEALAVSSLPGVRHIERDSTRQLLTDNGPRWIGADAVWGEDPPTGNADCVGTCGEGVVVGIIDTGINFDHPSFADIGGDGYNHTNPRAQFYGACAPVTGLPFCNDKLIGYYDFSGTGPEDDNGHGSHTASTTAGNVLHAVLEAPTITLERDISGVAPHANIIAYKGCSGTPVGCQLTALVGAINAATLDAVDVINYSIGGASANPWEDLDAQAFADSNAAGIFVATSAGNDGPGFGTLGSPADAPWVTSVGASTHDRKLANGIVDMTNADTSAGPADIFGKSLTAPLAPAARVVYAGDYATESNDPAHAYQCGSGVGDPATGEGSGGNPWPAGTFNGEIVVCERGEYGRVAKGEYVRLAGAGGYVLVNDAASGDSLIGDPYTLPGVHITYDDGLVLLAWIADNGGKTHQGTAEINGSNPDEDPAFGDVMASFSSRGANQAAPDLIKPDVTAPGVDILAAWMTPLGTVGGDPEFDVISGTSMSSPHTAGAAALVRAAQPLWSPDEVKSALMTTAFTTTPGNGAEVHGVLKEDSATPADPFDMGAGRVDLHVATKAGIVLDETAANYEAANPAAGGDATALNIASLGNDFCLSSCSWTRAITSTAGTSVTWTPSATTPAGVLITFNQPSYTLAPGATVNVTVTANVDGVSPKGQWTFAEVQLTPSISSIPAAHLPVAVLPPSGQEPVVLHMHGNIHDGCTGNGATDVLTGAGFCQPHLSDDPILDTNPAAAWGPINATVDGVGAQNIHDPNWIWELTEDTTLQGPMTVEYWYTSPNKETVFNLDFTIRLFADGVLWTEQLVRHNALTPQTELFRDTINVPKITATDSYVVQIDPFFVTQNGAFIYYDSTQPCPGTLPGTTAPCDSRVSMPVVELIDNPPVAEDDEAFVVRGGTVVVDVLANDFDAEGPLAVTIVAGSGPFNGTADVTTDNRIVYTHDGTGTTSDSLVYEITDTAGQQDQATVYFTIADTCYTVAGDYYDDFETDAPGWTVDTAVLTPPSQTWQHPFPDPLFATSGTTVWFTDALASHPIDATSKDVRLVSPELLVSGDSHLTFFHKFRTEPGFDGGVLEVTTDGGTTWLDILDAGGVFVAGAYNTTPLNPGSDFVLSGRRAWDGESVGFPAMIEVDVDLGALAGLTAQFRFRFGQDQLAPEAGGWWIDDVAVNDLLEECSLPPVANNDSASVDAGMSTNIDVLANDDDPDDDNSALTVTIESGPSHGTAVVESNDTITYTHNGDGATSDSFQYRVTDPDGGFDTATVSITINRPENAPPVAVDDTGTVNASGSTTIDVKANDSDPDNENGELTVLIETQPTHGAAGLTGDGQVTYTHNGDDATSDSFEYRLTDPEGAFDIATVSITINQPPDDFRKTTGGGYLLTPEGNKLNFGFNAQEEADGSLHGNLQYNDKSEGVKIHLTAVLTFNTLERECGSVPLGPSSAEFTGSGTYNGTDATFRVCVSDVGEPGSGSGSDADWFHVECTTVCEYNSALRAEDEQLDGGNIQVHDPGAEASGTAGDESSPDATEPTASTLILDPVLLTEGEIGSIQELTVRAFGPDQATLAGVSVSINVLDASGNLLDTLTGVSDATGLLTISVVIGAGETEFLAFSGGLSSNAIAVTGRPPGGIGGLEGA
ncbi:MAG: S8 family serine peptidase [Chloroflexota bacterium]